MSNAERYCDEAERLRGEATPGPWEWYMEDASMISLVTVGYPLEGHVLTSALCDPCHKRHGKKDGKVAPFEKAHCLMPRQPDRDHIVAMHNSQEALLRVVRAAADEALGGHAACGPGNPYWGAWRELQDALDALRDREKGEDDAT